MMIIIIIVELLYNCFQWAEIASLEGHAVLTTTEINAAYYLWRIEEQTWRSSRSKGIQSSSSPPEAGRNVLNKSADLLPDLIDPPAFAN